MKTTKELDIICTQIRRDILRMVHANNSGHPGGSLGCTEFLSVLYFNHLKHNLNFNMRFIKRSSKFCIFHDNFLIHLIKTNLINKKFDSLDTKKKKM